MLRQFAMLTLVFLVFGTRPEARGASSIDVTSSVFRDPISKILTYSYVV